MRPLRMTDDIIKRILKQVEENLKGARTQNNMTVSVPTKLKPEAGELPPSVLITPQAELKMKALVAQCAKEIAWHGIVDRDYKSNTYTIQDILVFPQEITAATVESVDEEYGPWLMNLPEEDFNKLRLHGHSHVNMGVNPSATDTNYQEELTNEVDDFYIFMIINKKGDYNIWIYNVEENIVYEKTDIIVASAAMDAQVWARDEIEQQVKEKKIVPKTNKVKNTAVSKKTTQYYNQLALKNIAQQKKAQANDSYYDGYYGYYGRGY